MLQLNNDHKNLLNLTIAVSFAKFHAQHFIIYAAAASPSSSSAPPAPSDVDHTTATTAVAAVTAPAKPASAPPLEMLTVDLKIKTACTTILTNYFEAVTRILVREHKVGVRKGEV